MIVDKKSVRYLLFGISSTIIGYFLGNQYRNYIYTNHIEDYGIADAGVNVFVVIMLTCYLWAFKIPKKQTKLSVLVKASFLYVGMEILSYFIPFIGVFDSNDIIAYSIGSLFSYIILINIEKNSFQVKD